MGNRGKTYSPPPVTMTTWKDPSVLPVSPLLSKSSDTNSVVGRKKDKYRDIPPDLRALWEKDRMKKADRRKARELERLATAADPLKKNKGGKKGRKAMSAAASSDPTIVVLPNRVIDMTTLVQQIRRFIADVGGPSSMSLPPTTRETRKSIHEMAQAFGLKSVSKGRDDARYTTLIKTTRTGNEVKEAKVSRILRRSGGAGARDDSFYPGGRNGRVYVKVPKQREGDEVGKVSTKNFPLHSLFNAYGFDCISLGCSKIRRIERGFQVIVEHGMG